MEKTKAIVTCVLSLICNWLGILAVPVFALLGCNLIDYITGIAAAKVRAPKDDKRPVKSYKSIMGIIKKVCMYFLIIIGWLVDILVDVSLCQIGIVWDYPNIIAMTIACWLIFNEIISILENMDDIDAPIPPFLLPLLEKMKQNIERKGESLNEDK